MEAFKISKKKSFLFKFTIFIQIVLMVLLFIDGKSYIPKNEKLAYAEIILSIIGLLALLLTYFFRKIGVYLYATVLLIVFALNPIKSDIIFTIFFFIGAGLSVLIPRWNLFK